MKSSAADDEEQLLCSRCVSDPFLKKRIRKVGQKAGCSFCDSKIAKAVPLGVIADWIEKV